MSRFKLTDEEVQHAVRWFSKQPESAPFFAALQSIIEEIAGPQDTCALHRHDERRRFAADLMAMAEAEASDGPHEQADRRNGSKHLPRKTLRRGPAGR